MLFKIFRGKFSVPSKWPRLHKQPNLFFPNHFQFWIGAVFKCILCICVLTAEIVISPFDSLKQGYQAHSMEGKVAAGFSFQLCARCGELIN